LNGLKIQADLIKTRKQTINKIMVESISYIYKVVEVDLVIKAGEREMIGGIEDLLRMKSAVIQHTVRIKI
jgi:hypothetical protein